MFYRRGMNSGQRILFDWNNHHARFLWRCFSSAKIVPLRLNTDNTGFAPLRTIFNKRSDWENLRRLPEGISGTVDRFPPDFD